MKNYIFIHVYSPLPYALTTEQDKRETMTDICVIYHSAYGHNKRIAEVIGSGISESGASVAVLSVGDLTEKDWETMDNAKMLVFGCPTYLGSVTADFKIFMDASGKRWLERTWQGKWAAGFTVSGGLSGDKLSVLQQISLFSAQHGMNWACQPRPATGRTETDFNRLSSFLGLMCQANDAPADVTPPQGDIDTAFWFGGHLASLVSS